MDTEILSDLKAVNTQIAKQEKRLERINTINKVQAVQYLQQVQNIQIILHEQEYYQRNKKKVLLRAPESPAEAAHRRQLEALLT